MINLENCYGLLPAAGLGTRMRPFLYPKELLPVYFVVDADNESYRPKLLIENSIESLSTVGVKNIYIVISDWKLEIMKYLSDGKILGTNISYLFNNKASGLADALLTGYPWLKNKVTCFCMPDTIFYPSDCFDILLYKMVELDADLMLGVFPTKDSTRLAPVEFDDSHKVLHVYEKPLHPTINNTWGVAVWNNKFWNFFESRRVFLTNDQSISDVFNDAASSELNVYSFYFENGNYKDLGDINNISIV